MRVTAFALLLAVALTTIINVECAKRRQQELLGGKSWNRSLLYGAGVWADPEVDCSKFKKLLPGEERICYSLYAPICGSDGKTYSNDCTFCDKVTKTDNKLKFVRFGKC